MLIVYCVLPGWHIIAPTLAVCLLTMPFMSTKQAGCFQGTCVQQQHPASAPFGKVDDEWS